MTERYCLGCRRFHDAKLHDCPNCGRIGARVNAGLVSQRWQSALNAKAERALREG